ncbi:uncharacterized protein LOC135434688 [Drosophila montana]|uniref:uncharacterized protein LOC135434688 n=1 Tax=Drosophila montana TaxID=40370 RepID=UPI00313B5110
MFQFSKIVLVFIVSLGLPSNLMGQCDVCQTEVPVACHSETSFSICLNGIPTEDYIECPKDYHCTGQKYICYPKASGTTNCVTGSTTTPATTTVTPWDPVMFCKETQTAAWYTNELDPTCATYVQCYTDNNEWTASVQECGSGFWFNGEYCDNEKPENCT